MLSFLHGKFHNRFELDLIEQSAVYVEEFRKHQAKAFCRTRTLHSLFEEAALTKNHYDLVLLIHSIFAFADDAAVGKILALRQAKGNVVVVANASSSFLGGLKERMDFGFDDKRYELDDLMRILREQDVSFTTQPFETTWAIEATRWERDLKVILDWISLGRYRKFSHLRKREITQYIAASTRRDGGRVLFRENEVAVVIPDLRKAEISSPPCVRNPGASGVRADDFPSSTTRPAGPGAPSSGVGR
jgi:hypothetical protein